jgi:hypothetical protein
MMQERKSIDYSKFVSVYHKQKQMFGIIVDSISKKTRLYDVTELDIEWENGTVTHLYASQYYGKFFDRYEFFEFHPSDKEKLAIRLKST